MTGSMMSSLLINAACNWSPTTSDTVESKENKQNHPRLVTHTSQFQYATQSCGICIFEGIMDAPAQCRENVVTISA